MDWADISRSRVSALEHRHAGARHKAANIILTKDTGIAKLTDFGMARLHETSTGQFTLVPNLPPGTPCYVAPEVLNGEKYDYRADLYSFGVLVWVLLTGGILSAKDPRPPCESRFALLGKNWQLLKKSVIKPEANDAQALPSGDAKDFVLRCIDRSPGYTLLTHNDIRKHFIFRELPALPRYGDYGALKEWLPESLKVSGGNDMTFQSAMEETSFL